MSVICSDVTGLGGDTKGLRPGKSLETSDLLLVLDLQYFFFGKPGEFTEDSDVSCVVESSQ